MELTDLVVINFLQAIKALFNVPMHYVADEHLVLCIWYFGI